MGLIFGLRNPETSMHTVKLAKLHVKIINKYKMHLKPQYAQVNPG